MKKFILTALICAIAFPVVSCKKAESYYEATATIKTAADNSCYFQIDDQTILFATNDPYKTNPLKKESRVHILYYDRGDAAAPSWGTATSYKNGEITGFGEILTKKPVEAGEYGDAEIELCDTWMNSIEDGYMTLCFECWWGGTKTTHLINLVKTDDPLHFQLRHDNAGDPAVYRSPALIAFDLHEMQIPDKQEYDVTVEYEGYVERKIVKFHCKDGVYSRPTRVDENGYLDSDE